jgi:hypothetical protein
LNQKEQMKMFEDLAKQDEELKEKLKSIKNNANEYVGGGGRACGWVRLK